MAQGQREMMVGSMANMPGGGGGKQNNAVIARLPPHIKSIIMFLSLSNSLTWVAFGFEWLGFDDSFGTGRVAFAAIAVFWCSFVIPIFMWLITRTDYGQRGG